MFRNRSWVSSVELVAAQGGWHGTIQGIPAGGARTFHADAFTTADLIYVGEVSPVTISPLTGERVTAGDDDEADPRANLARGSRGF